MGKKDDALVILACEVQENVHYAMPVRNMLYDSLSYTNQINEMWDSLSDEEKRIIPSEEFLSHFRKEDFIYPVITIVFYYGDNWDGSLDLQLIFGMLKYKDDKEKLFNFTKDNKSYFSSVNGTTINAIDAFLNFNVKLETILEKDEKEEKDMCKALDDLYNDGIEKGKCEGRLEGEVVGTIKTLYSYMDKTPEEISDIVNQPIEYIKDILYIS